jgi:hypothetical protein
LSKSTKATVALCGSDRWLRHALHPKLDHSATVRDVGTGTSYLHGVTTLVIIPALLPRTNAGLRDVAVQPSMHTLHAAMTFGLTAAVLVSRIGVERGADTYSAALAALERTAHATFKRLTIVRLAHPFGPPEDPGPVLEALAAGAGGGAKCQPLFVDDATAVIAAAAGGRLGTGVVEYGGPRTMTLDELASAAPASPSTERRGGLRRMFSPSARGAGAALESFLSIDSVVDPAYAAPMAGPPRSVFDVWPAPVA